jgi:hypothetical protein
MSEKTFDAPVLIAGGGLVGLSADDVPGAAWSSLTRY